jgi:3-oxoadipate enol-lactonase
LSPYFHSPEGKLYYALQAPRAASPSVSSASTLVFIHGAFGSHRLWDRQVPFFSSLSYRVLTLDVRGHGSSFKPRAGYELDRMVEDVRALLEHLKITTAVFVGSSMGGVIAQMIAIKYPKRVTALVLVGTLAKAVWLGRAAEYAKAGGSTDGYKRGVRSWFTPHSDRRDVQIALREAAKASRRFGAGVILQNPSWDIRVRITKISAPTMIVVGGGDVNTTPVAESREIHHLIKNSEMFVVPEVGHLVMLERPDRFNELMEDFLIRRKLSAPGAGHRKRSGRRLVNPHPMSERRRMR